MPNQLNIEYDRSLILEEWNLLENCVEDPLLLLDEDFNILKWNIYADRKFKNLGESVRFETLARIIPEWDGRNDFLSLSFHAAIRSKNRNVDSSTGLVSIWRSSSNRNFYFVVFEAPDSAPSAHNSFSKGRTLSYSRSFQESDFQTDPIISGTKSLTLNDESIKSDSPDKEQLLSKISILNLLQQISTAANEADDVEALLQFALDRICLISGWKLGRVYLWSSETEMLELAPIWYMEEEAALKALKLELEKQIHSIASGIAMRVIRERKVIWIEDIRSEFTTLQQDLARKAGISFCCSIPLFVRETIVGVLEFFSGPEVPEPSFLEALRHIGSQIGRVFERTYAENYLRNSREELRALAARLQRVREEERVRIAREIHDELGQLLTVLKIDLSLLRKKKNDIVHNEERLMDEINSMNKIADSAIQSVQRIATELRPLILDDLGLLEGIEWYVKDFQNRSGIICSISIEVDVPLSTSAESATAIFRILQETLTNVIRHSQATIVDVSLSQNASNLRLSVHDNGVGIPTDKISNSKSLGLIGMRERATVLGGELTIENNNSKGTTVTVRIPRGETLKTAFP
ncbi:GHKL domain protein [Leptospira inadai serovar Lyme str. 10]|uniref:Oxygen sensor histidine kinase NreB n=2 Tax=Leptospira inadai serovar Lyme TaxID=293084 RepID=V6HBU6_9LEPT|nr:GAF domain-containing sensor histidine kinase [Leptospira inadai]EQA37206.1 GHKL domain protein [Leptospira inadai serovar Lyme str. 10]PNV76237.1 histidine kinase [Leptospira inadai serovar Lyme]